MPTAWHDCATLMSRLCQAVGTVVSWGWHKVRACTSNLLLINDTFMKENIASGINMLRRSMDNC